MDPVFKKNGGECIHIGAGFDRNYLRHFFALLGSLIESHHQNRLQLHVIAEGLRADEMKRIVDLISRSGHDISFYELDRSLVDRFQVSGQWTPVVYYRLFFSLLLPSDIQRLIYLDCDTVVIKSLWPLYSIELDGYPIAAVYDNYVKTQPRIGIFKEGEYFNSGVMLIDLNEWRNQNVSENASTYLVTYPEKILFVDQCALNAVLKDNWKKLQSRFNLMYSALPQGISRRQMNEVLQDAVVVHFTLHRPWQMLCKNRLRFLYFYYLRRSGIKISLATYYTDFELRKLPAFLAIRLHEFYFDMPFIQKVWRFLQAK